MKGILNLILIAELIIFSSQKTAKEFLDCVKAQLGKPYVWGATGPNSFDCSGLVYYCFDGQVPRVAADQKHAAPAGDGSPGDLVFFGEGNEISHVGICVGNGQMIHAPHTGDVVSYKQYAGNPYYDARNKGYGRYWSGTGNIDKHLDYLFYARKYEDLNNAFGNDKAALNQHWLDHGKKEGRAPNAYIDPIYYREHNKDIKNTFGTDYEAIYNHFYENGIKEGRNSSPIYYGVYYRNKYPDLRNLSYKDLLNHFVKYGMKEGRQAHPDFDVSKYKKKNPDLVKVFKKNNKAYYKHYLEYGIREGRAH